MSPGELLYVYGIVRPGFDAAGLPQGLEDAPVSLFTRGGAAALLSRLSAGSYDAATLEAQSGDVAWLSARAMAHDRVLTWAQEHGGVIPLPMFSMWESEDSLARSLAERAPALARVFARLENSDEFGVRVHRRDEVMLAASVLDDLDPAIAELRAAANAASPGQRYLLERKLAESAKSAARAAGQRLARETFDELQVLARDAVSRPLVPPAGNSRADDATMILNAAFLVERGRLDAFRAALGARVARDEPRGLSFDFTGPWPPWNFVDEAGAPAPRAQQ